MDGGTLSTPATIADNKIAVLNRTVIIVAIAAMCEGNELTSGTLQHLSSKSAFDRWHTYLQLVAKKNNWENRLTELSEKAIVMLSDNTLDEVSKKLLDLVNCVFPDNDLKYLIKNFISEYDN